MISTRSASAAASRLCVASTTVCPPCRARALINCTISRPTFESRFPVGSSASRSAGRCASARASATRCCSPPDNSDGRCSPRCARPTAARHSSTRFAGSASPRSRSGSATFSRAVSPGSRLKNWKTTPIRSRRSVVHSVSVNPRVERPSMRMSPSVGRSSPPIRLSSVLLPLPLGPMTARNSPLATSSEIPCTARMIEAPR